MTALRNDEYRKLELGSSELLMERDHQRVMGRRIESSASSFRAGTMRERMGQMAQSEGQALEGTMDLLSAAQCFLDARSLVAALRAVDVLEALARRGAIPHGRSDLHQDLDARRRDVGQLQRDRDQFIRAFVASGHRLDVPGQATLAFLQQHLASLPGDAQLHYAIFRQADLLGDDETALRHLRWTATFDPDNPHWPALLGYRLLARGDRDGALRAGEAFLAHTTHTAAPVRLMLALALGPEGAERALELLRPLREDATAPPRQLLAALLLTALLLREQGAHAELDGLRIGLGLLQHSVAAPEVQVALQDLHPALFAERNGAGLPAPARQRLLDLVRQLGREPEALAT